MFHSLKELNKTLVKCTRCSELVEFREKLKDKIPNGLYKPVPGLGDENSRIIIVGLAPSIRGSGKTGRMFTGDKSGDFLWNVLLKCKLAKIKENTFYPENCFLTAVLRCPINTTTPKAVHIHNCLDYLRQELSLIKRANTIVALGEVAWKNVLKIYGKKEKFKIGKILSLPTESEEKYVIASYHPSPRNVNTNKFTEKMAIKIFEKAKKLAGILSLLFGIMYSQTMDCSDTIYNLKLKKCWEEATDKKYALIQKLEKLKKCEEMDPSNAKIKFEIAKLIIRLYKMYNLSLKSAEERLRAIAETCPDFHSDVFFYLGEIYLGRENYKEASYFYEKFLKFNSTDESKYSKDIDEKIRIAQENYKYSKTIHELKSITVPFFPNPLKNTSTPDDEYLPALTVDNSAIFFTRALVQFTSKDLIFAKDVVDKIEKLYVAYRINENEFKFTQGEPLPAPFNTRIDYLYGGASFNASSSKMYLTICKPAKYGYSNCDIYISYKGEDLLTWKEPQEIKELNTPDGWESQPSVTPDEKVIFFATARANSQKMDIFYAVREGSSFSEPRPLPPIINTPYNEKSPFIHPDGRTLYFASDGHIGLGGYDLFVSQQLEDGSWSPPKNLGSPINSPEDEHGLIVSLDGKYAIFASSRFSKENGGGLDLIYFELPPNVRPDKVIYISGQIEKIPKDSIPLIQAIDITNNKVYEASIDSSEKKYAIVVNVQKTDAVILNVVDSNSIPTPHLVYSKEDTINAGKKINIDLSPTKISQGERYCFPNIGFEYNSASLKPQAKEILNIWANFLKNNPLIEISIEGHTDDIGDDQFNLRLSEERAKAVYDYFIQRGISPQRMQYKGLGESAPLLPNTSPENREKNRRTEIIITKIKK